MDRLPFEFNCKKVNQGYSTPITVDPYRGYRGTSATVNTPPTAPPAESIHQAELNCKKANQGYSTPITVDPVRGYNPIGARGTQPMPPNPSLSVMSFPTNGDQENKREITEVPAPAANHSTAPEENNTRKEHQNDNQCHGENADFKGISLNCVTDTNMCNCCHC